MNYYKSFKKSSENASREVQKKFPTQGKGTPLFLDPIPCNPGPLGLATYQVPTLLMLLILTFYTELCKYYNSIEKWSENATREIQKSKISYPGKGDTPFLGSQSPPLALALLAFEHTKVLKSGLKLRLERFKKQNFPTKGKGKPLSLDPIPHSLSPSGLGNYQVHYLCCVF